MGTPEGFKLAIGIQEYDLFAKPGDKNDVDIIVTHEGGQLLARAKMVKSGSFVIYESPLNPLEQLGIEKLLEVGKPDIEEIVRDMVLA